MLAVSAISFAWADTPVPPTSTLSFTKSIETVIKSTTALVNVTVNATALKDDSQIIQQAALQRLEGVLPKVDWKVIDLDQTQAASGAQNIKIIIQARLNDTQIQQLKSELKNNNSNNSSFKIDVVSYDPSNEMIDKAKDQTMVQMYQSIQQYVKKFNQDTHSHYVIQNISYNANEAVLRDNRAALYVRAADSMKNASTAKKSKDIAVSKKFVMNAYVTLSQPLPVMSQTRAGNMDKGNKMTAKVLPPEYLSVDGYQICLQTKDNGSWQSWCMPKEKPAGCSDDSWAKLSQMKDIPSCA